MKRIDYKKKERMQKGDDKDFTDTEKFEYYFKNVNSKSKEKLIWLAEKLIVLERNSKKIKLFLGIIVTTLILNTISTVVAGVNVFEIILKWNENVFITNSLSKSNSEELTSNYEEIESYKEFKFIEDKLNVKLLKLNYIPNEFNLEEITVSEDKNNTTFRISALYPNKIGSRTLVYNAYIAQNLNVNSQIIQEKTQKDSVVGYFKCNNIEIPYNIFENTNWYSATWNYNNIVYELYGIESKDELIKIINSIYLN